MKKQYYFFIISLIVLSSGFADSSSEAMTYSVPGSEGVVVDSYQIRDDISCSVSQDVIDAVQSFLGDNFNLSSYAYSNYSDSYCYFYNDYENIYINFIFKESESDYKGKQVSFSFSTSQVYDFNSVFSDLENKVLGYTLKQKYVDYLISGVDEEYYVTISNNYDVKNGCELLRNFYNSLTGEKYFEEDEYYCSIVAKVKTSELKSLVDDKVGYVYYYTDDLSFTFSGYFEGSFDLEQLYNILDCDLSKNNYYYPEFDSDCYGIYKDKPRIYFSKSESLGDYWVNLYVYGIIGGKAQFNFNAYGEDLSLASAQAWVNNLLSSYFPSYSLNLELKEEYYSTYISGESLVEDFTFDASVLISLDSRQEQMNTYYEGDNLWITLSEPYIQIRPSIVLYKTSSEIMPYPYWQQTMVITSDKVFSSITVDDNDESLAVEELNSFVSPFIAPGDWVLDMSVSGHYYIMPLAEAGGVDEAAIIQSSAVSETGVRDAFSTNYDVFNELEETEQENKQSFWDWVLSLFK
ncbi:MAG: hypothetical protein JW791_02710 [Nanoarchaeota archaeon]|nr:hypothetical protein [Nanoarchaeota archaeon]